ncbi:DUF2577 family protein [Clostridium beijerinckii]|uniref:DUF2577 family protein n=1 Tax=Clostridium beijerinckii TaxID=1520 RepID=UPI00232E9137|nr:DUF2577 family protein [Clostridium beijerinckii]
MAKWEEKWIKHVEKASKNAIDLKEIEMGRIVSVNPLEIINGDLSLFEDNLYINPNLLDHTREFNVLTGTIGGSTTTISDGFIYFKSELNQDDLVALIKLNKKKYLVLFKIGGVQ